MVLMVASYMDTFAQITVMKSKDVEKSTSADIYEYDSLTNVLKKDGSYMHMIGQRLMLIHSAVQEERKLNRKMYTDATGYYLSHLKELDGKGVDDEQYLGKNFIVNSYEKFGLRQSYVFKLKEEESNKILTYELSSSLNYANRQFVCEGYFNKMKTMYVGKEYVFVECNSLAGSSYKFASNSLISLDDEKEFTPSSNSIWKCIDVTIYIDDIFNKRYGCNFTCPIILIFQNAEGKKAYHYLQNEEGQTAMANSIKVEYGDNIEFVERPLFLGCFVTKEENAKYLAEQAEKDAAQKKAAAQKLATLTKKYGATNAKLIVERKVKIGWSKALCKAAWGEPEKINTTTGSWGTHEQWVYGDNSYLYFENGKLTSIQN